jgi:hypothetical protein
MVRTYFFVVINPNTVKFLKANSIPSQQLEAGYIYIYIYIYILNLAASASPNVEEERKGNHYDCKPAI